VDLLGIPSAVWLPIATLILGGVLTAFFDAQKDRRALDREREARKDQRSDTLLLKRIEFQRDTLLALQDAIASFGRFTGQMHLHDEQVFRETKEWGKSQLGEEISNGAFAANVLLDKLRVRVDDDTIREQTSRFRLLCLAVGEARSESTSTGALNEAMAVMAPLHERIGEVLRNLDKDEEAVA